MNGAKAQYVVQENGQVTLPQKLRQELTLKKGDAVAFRKTTAGWLVEKPEADPFKLLDQLGEALQAKGVSLDEWMESGREIRAEILEEKYGVKAKDD